MSGVASTHSYPNDNWSEYSQTQNEQSLKTNAFLFPIDESEEFHDPFSDLNLYLAKKVKQSIKAHGTTNKWSSHIQTDLLNKIVPEFRLKFPRYRLGLSALKKVWEKVMYYSEKVESEKEAIASDGKVNLSYMIRENLRKYPIRQGTMDVHPSHYAYQLAVKMSECIATLDGEKPILDRLTKTIWSVQKHLLPKAATHKRSAFEQYDIYDKLIVKTLLELGAKSPHLTQSELKEKISETLQSLIKIKSEIDESQISSLLSILLANKLLPQASASLLFSLDSLEKMKRFIRGQFALCPRPKSVAPPIYYMEMIKRISHLITCAGHLPPSTPSKTFTGAVKYIYHLATNQKAPSEKHFEEVLLQFVNAQFSLIKQHFDRYSLEEIIEMMSHCHKQAMMLPKFADSESSEIEVLIWSIIAEIDSDFSSLPAGVKELFEEEIANSYLEDEGASFTKCVQNASQFFKKVRNLSFDFSTQRIEDSLRNISHVTNLEHKISDWSLQNDMICAKIQMDETTPLLFIIKELWEEKHMEAMLLSHEEFIEAVKERYLQEHPRATPFAEELASRISILYKYFWYNLLSAPSESSYDRFLKWHYLDLKKHLSKQSREQILEKIAVISQKTLPLTPFSANYLAKITE